MKILRLNEGMCFDVQMGNYVYFNITNGGFHSCLPLIKKCEINDYYPDIDKKWDENIMSVSDEEEKNLLSSNSLIKKAWYKFEGFCNEIQISYRY